MSLSINFLPVMARLTSLAASSRASIDACSLYQDVCGVQIRLGASFRGPVEKLFWWEKKTQSNEVCWLIFVYMLQLTRAVHHVYLKGSVSWTSRAAPRIRPSLRAWASAFSSTRPPLDVFTRKAPWRICSNIQKLKPFKYFIVIYRILFSTKMEVNTKKNVPLRNQ